MCVSFNKIGEPLFWGIIIIIIIIVIIIIIIIVIIPLTLWFGPSPSL